MDVWPTPSHALYHCVLTLMRDAPFRFDHLSSYTYPLLEALQHDKAKCDLFGTFVETEHKFLAASKEAIADIEQIARTLDDELMQQSQNIVTVTFTLLAVFTFGLLLAGSFFITDSQRVRLVSLRLKAIVVWNRLVHRNRVYDVGASHASTDVRITGVQDTRYDRVHFHSVTIFHSDVNARS
jgi:hypothetical protein